MENSSNKNMNDVFEQLAAIKATEPSAGLYVKTFHKAQRQNSIPLNWVGAVVCGFFVFVVAVSYLGLNSANKSSEDISKLFYTTNNTLYHE